MAAIFWDGFDKYGAVNQWPTGSSIGGEWTGLPPAAYSGFVAGRFSGSLAFWINYGYTATRGLPGNYSRLIGGVAMRPSLAGNSWVQFADGGVLQGLLGFNAQGKLVLWQGAAGNAQIAVSSAGVTSDSWHYVEWDLTFASAGAYTVWLDGVVVLSGTGNLQASANAYANAIGLCGYACGFDDMYLFDATGTANNAVRGDSRVETLFPTADAAVSFTPGQGVIGAWCDLNGFTAYMAANILVLRKFTPVVAGTLDSVAVLPQTSAPAANFKPAVYADSGGLPGALLSSGAGVSGATAGTALSLPLATPQALVAGTPVWLGYLTDSALTMAREDASTAPTNLGLTAYVTFANGAPASAPAMTAGQASLAIWGQVSGIAANYAEVNQAPPAGDLSYVTASTVGQEDRYGFGAMSSTPASIAGVKVSALMRKSDSGARTVTLQVKSGATEVSGGPVAPGASYAYAAAYFDTDPDTGAAWTAAAVNGLSAGIKIAS